MTTTDKAISAYAERHANVLNKLNEAGIGEDFAERYGVQLGEIGAFCADAQARITRQALYNMTINVPCGVMRHADCTARAAILRALPGVCGEFVAWDISDALDLAADILDDVNAHSEAEALRRMKRT